jgi:hypothetical protein
LGETGGDSVTMTLNWGYLDGTRDFLRPSYCPGRGANSR